MFFFFQAKTIFNVKKLDPNITWSQGLTGLHIAARGGYIELVKFLLEAGADVNIKGTYIQISSFYIAVITCKKKNKTKSY